MHLISSKFISFAYRNKMDPTPLHPKVMTKLPDMAVYGPGVAGNVRRKTTVQVQPQQGSVFTPNGQRIIQIQLPKNGFLNGLNSFLCFKHQSTNAKAAASQSIVENNALSTSASNWIQRLRIKIGGKIVEDIDDYNVLHEILRNSIVTSQFRDSLAGQLEGYEPSWVAKMVEPLSPANGTKVVFNGNGIDGVKVNRNRSGGYGQLYTAAAPGEKWSPADAEHTLQYWAANNKEYQVILLSGLLRSAKYLPLRFMPPVEIEITLADFARSHVWAPARDAASVGSYYTNCLPNAAAAIASLRDATGATQSGVFFSHDTVDCEQPVVAGDSGTTGRHPVANGGASNETPATERTYTISQINFVAEILEFDDSFYQAFEASLSQGITIPYITYTNHVYSLAGMDGDIQIAERVRSARSLLAVCRLNGDLSHAPYPKFMFVRNNLQQFQVKIGTQYFPMHPISVLTTDDQYAGERLVELQKVIASMADVSHGMTTSAGDAKYKFIIGMDLQREFDRLSGLDTTKGLPLFLSLRGSGNSSDTNCTLNIFVSYDMFVDLFPGEVVEVLN